MVVTAFLFCKPVLPFFGEGATLSVTCAYGIHLHVRCLLSSIWHAYFDRTNKGVASGLGVISSPLSQIYL